MGVKYLVMNGDQTLGSEYTMEYTDKFYKFKPELYIYYQLTNTTPIN